MNLKVKFVFLTGLLVLGRLVLPDPMRADTVTVYMNSSGAVSSTDRSATFDSLTTGAPITLYTENSLKFSIPGAFDYTAFSPAPAGFTGGFLYPSGSSLNPLTISTTDSATLYGLQFNLGSGFFSENAAGDSLPIAYQLYSGATVVGSGTFSALQTASGYLLGFSDPSGFTSLVIADCASGGPCSIGSQNAIAIDNVAADLTGPNSSVPEPGAITLLATVLVALGWFARKRIVPNF